MKRLIVAACAILMGIALLAPDAALAAPTRVVKERRQAPRRTVVVVRPGHPIRRAMPKVIERRPNVVVRVTPARFLPMVVWRPVVVVDPPMGDRLAWQDAETLSRRDGWSETIFDSDQRGDRLFLRVAGGRVQFDFAEVVFENGDCRVVDFANRTHGPGLYSLLDFPGGRRVDHVRLVARATSAEARVALLLQK